MDVICLQWCHSNLHCGKCKHQVLKSSPLVYHTPKTLPVDSRCSRTKNITFTVFLFKTRCLLYPQCNSATGWHYLWHVLSDYMQLPLEPQKAFYHSLTYAVVLRPVNTLEWVKHWCSWALKKIKQSVKDSLKINTKIKKKKLKQICHHV